MTLGLIARPIGKLPLINVASPAYLARRGTPRTPGDLGGHRAVNYASPSSGRIEDWEWVEDGVLRSVPVRGRVTVNSAEAYIACCLAGLGMIRRHLSRRLQVFAHWLEALLQQNLV